MALGGIELLRTAGAAFIPRTAEIGLGGAVLAFLTATTVAAAILFGLIPALHGAAFKDQDRRSTGRGTTDAAGPRRLRRVLVMAEFAVATPLLIAAGLLIASLSRLQRVDVGFDRQNVLTGAILLPREQYSDSGHIAAFWEQVRSRVEGLPGVQGVAFSDGRPPTDVSNENNFDLEDDPTPPGQSQPTSLSVSVTPEYFRLLGITLLQGRAFERQDGEGDPVVVVDRSWVSRFSPGKDPVGRRFHEGGCGQCPANTIVGVVSDVKYGGIDQPDRGTVYWPMAGRPLDHQIDQATARFRYLVVRTSRDPAGMIPSIRRIVHDLDPGLPISDVATIDEMMEDSLQVPRYLSLLVGGFPCRRLSAIGILYGVMSYFVEQHSKDIGIRIALGGAPTTVSRMWWDRACGS